MKKIVCPSFIVGLTVLLEEGVPSFPLVKRSWCYTHFLLLYIVYCTAHCIALYTVYCILLYFVLYTIYFSVHHIFYTVLLTVNCISYVLYSLLYNAFCIQYIVMYTVYCTTLYNVLQFVHCSV